VFQGRASAKDKAGGTEDRRERAAVFTVWKLAVDDEDKNTRKNTRKRKKNPMSRGESNQQQREIRARGWLLVFFCRGNSLLVKERFSHGNTEAFYSAIVGRKKGGELDAAFLGEATEG